MGGRARYEINKNCCEHASTQKTSHSIKELERMHRREGKKRAIEQYILRMFIVEKEFFVVVTRPEYEGGNFNRTCGLTIIYVTFAGNLGSVPRRQQGTNHPQIENCTQQKMNCFCQNSNTTMSISYRCITCINNATETAEYFYSRRCPPSRHHSRELCFIRQRTKIGIGANIINLFNFISFICKAGSL